MKTKYEVNLELFSDSLDSALTTFVDNAEITAVVADKIHAIASDLFQKRSLIYEFAARKKSEGNLH